MKLLPCAEVLCPLVVRIIKGFFFKEMYENFVGTKETVLNRELSV